MHECGLFPKLIGEGVPFIIQHVAEDDARSLPNHQPNGGSAESPCASSDERDLVFESVHDGSERPLPT
jgi:hypothetical protein